MMILIGFAIGWVIAILLALWLTRPSGDFMIIDKWWLEDAKRWEWLRQYEYEPKPTTPGQTQTLSRNSARKHRR